VSLFLKEQRGTIDNVRIVSAKDRQTMGVMSYYGLLPPYMPESWFLAPAQSPVPYKEG
jgi:hypothetical protein